MALHLGIKVPGVPFRGIDVPGLVRRINENSDVYSGVGGRPIQIGEVYQHIRPGHWAWQGIRRKLLKMDAFAHASGRFDLYRALEGSREIVAKGRFKSQEYSRGDGALETDENLELQVVAPIYLGRHSKISPLSSSRTIMPGTIRVKTSTDNSGRTAVLEYTYSQKDESLPVDERTVQIIPERWFVA